MTNRIIHINYLPQHDRIVKSFMNKNINEYIICNQQLRDVSIDVDMGDENEREITINKITELILIVFREKNLKEYIWSNYRNLEEEGKKKVYLEAKLLLDKKEKFIKSTIQNKLVQFIDTESSINIDGFLRFRMKDFMVYISIISDIALEEYLIKRDKEQFVNTLKYFIESQENRTELLIIHINKDGSFRFCDQDGLEIKSKDSEDILRMIRKEDLNYEDFLISILIALCPKKIEIIDDLKNKTSKEIIDNIKLIFDDNVKVIFKN